MKDAALGGIALGAVLLAMSAIALLVSFVHFPSTREFPQTWVKCSKMTLEMVGLEGFTAKCRWYITRQDEKNGVDSP